MDIRKASLREQMAEVLAKEGITEFRPAQQKALAAGLLSEKNLLVCTPTASGKTLIAEIACLEHILSGKGKAVYVVPLKALAGEKYKDFSRRYGHICRIALSIGDKDSAESRLSGYDLIICTSEKLDSLMRHHSPWISQVSVVIIDEVHLLNDPGRGPTLEVVVTMLRMMRKGLQVVALSATIGNARELARWLDAELGVDSWRPVPLHKGTFLEGEVRFY